MKKLTAALLVLVMALAMLPDIALAETEVWYDSVNGNEYTISTADQFLGFVGKANTFEEGKQSPLSGITVKLSNDITITLNDTGSGYDECDRSLWIGASNITLDLNGKTLTTISNYGGSNNVLNIIATGWTIKNGTIIAKRASGAADSYAIGVEYKGGTITLGNVSLSGGVAAYNTVTVTMKDTKIGKTQVAATNYYCAYAESGATFIADGGEYTSNGTNPIFYANTSKDSKIIIYGGKFTGEIFGTDNVTPGTITISGGTFSHDPSEYLAEGKIVVASGNSKYPFAVSDGTVNANVEVEAATVAAKADTTGKSAEVTSAISAAAEKAKNTTSEGLNVAAKNEATKITDKDVEAATQKLEDEGVDVTTQTDGTSNVTIYVQPYLDIQVKDAEVKNSEEGDSTTSTTEITAITLDIVPMVKTIASTATEAKDIETKDNGTKSKNAVEISAKETAVTTPVTITIPLPESFAADEGEKVFIKHTKKDGTPFVYEATVSGDKKITFTNPNGFSTFVISVDDPTKAVVVTKDGVTTRYADIQSVLNAANDGDKITLKVSGNLGSFTMSGADRTITLENGTESTITVTINGVEYKLMENGATAQVIYTAPVPTSYPLPSITPYKGSSSSSGGNTYSWYFNPTPTPTPTPVMVAPAVALPKTGDMTIWQSILSFFGLI